MSDLTGTKGGSGVWQRIISEMPAHRVYVEPFWGRGTIARLKKPAEITIGCDLDPAALSSGRVLGAMMFEADALKWLRDYFLMGALPGPAAENRVARGARNFASKAHAADSRGEDLAAEKRGEVSRRNGHHRPRNSPAGSAAAESSGSRGSNNTPATFGGAAWSEHFVYLDPPYLGCSGYYRHELTEAQHVELCRLFLALPCPAALSGYASDVYAAELGAARELTIPTVNRAGKRVTEHLWLNFDPPLRYHDTRFIGSGRRERERINRRRKNWAAGLAKLPAAERQAIFEACDAVYRGSADG